MKDFKFLSILLTIIIVTGPVFVGCEKIGIKAVQSNSAESSTVSVVPEISQEEPQKTESVNSDSAESKAEDDKAENAQNGKENTSSKTDAANDKAGIEKKVENIAGITEENLKTMKWSPDGKTLIYATGDNYEDRCVYLWNVGEAEPHKANIENGWGCDFGWSPNSEYVLVDGGTSALRSIVIIDKTGNPIKKGNETLYFETSAFAHPNLKLKQLWSSDSAKIIIPQYNFDITALPDVELSGVFDIIVYNVKEGTTKTLLKSSATKYYIIDKWVDNNTIRCNEYMPKNNKLGDVVETKDIKIN